MFSYLLILFYGSIPDFFSIFDMIEQSRPESKSKVVIQVDHSMVLFELWNVKKKKKQWKKKKKNGTNNWLQGLFIYFCRARDICSVAKTASFWKVRLGWYLRWFQLALLLLKLSLIAYFPFFSYDFYWTIQEIRNEGVNRLYSESLMEMIAI